MNDTSERRPTTFWQGLFEPHPSLKEVGARRQARLIAIIALVLTMTNVLGATASYAATRDSQAAIILFALAAFSGIGYFLARRLRYRVGGYLIVWLLTASAFTNPSGAESISFSLYVYLVVAITFASISFPFRYMLFYVIFCNLTIPFLHFFYPGYTNAGFDLAIFFPYGALVLIAMRYRDNVERDRLKEVTTINRELEDIKASLEIGVDERTKQLEEQSLRLRVIAEIARDAVSANDVNELLERSAQLIQDRFNFYHTGIFLLDNDHEYAALIASPTDAGKQMIANGYKVRMDEMNIVGRVARTGDPLISLDMGPSANNSFLPKTRSEMSLPLKVKNKTIGVLDIQSTETQAFGDEDMASMQILTDQLAVAVERTRLLQLVEENFRQLEKAYGQSTREGWKSLAESGLLKNTGYRFDNIRIQPINALPELGANAMQSGKPIIQDEKANDLGKQVLAAIPIKIRGQAIGAVTVKLKEGYSPSTINTIEQAIERLGGSLESVRLFEEARSRANREQAIAQVTSAISSATEFDSILRTTVEEIGRSLGNADVSIQIVSDPKI